MITLTINNSYSHITGLTSDQHKKLKAILSYEIDQQAAYFSKNRFNNRKYLIDNKGCFRTGLLSTVMRFIRENALKCSTIDDRKVPTTQVPINATFRNKPYKQQLEALHTSIPQKQATISMCTGSGKSMVIAMLINKLKVKTLVVVPNLELKRQLTESLEQIFGKTPHIVVENIDSAGLTFARNFDCLIIDEAHHASATTYLKHNKHNWTGIFYRFFLTATPMRTKTEENILLQSIAGDVCYELSYKKAKSIGLVVPVEAYYIDLPKQKTDAYTWQQVYSELVVNNQDRNKIMADLLLQLREAGTSALCLVKEVKHGKAIASYYGTDFINGQDEASRQYIRHFNERRIYDLIGTEGCVGEGVDTKTCEYVIIGGLGKAPGAFQQKVGRAIRTYPGKESAIVIIFRDSSHKYTLSHFNAQKKILLDYYGVDVIKLDI